MEFMMSIYEITFITKDEKNNDVQKLITQEGGTIINEKSLGRKKFTYPIKRETAGFYWVIIFELNNQKMFNLDKDLRMNQEIVRYLTISYEKEYSRYELEKKMAELREPKHKSADKKSDKPTNGVKVDSNLKTEKKKEKIKDNDVKVDNKELKEEKQEIADYLPEILDETKEQKDETEELKNIETNKEQENIETEETKKVTSDPSGLDEADEVTPQQSSDQASEKEEKKEEEKPKVVLPKAKKEAVSEEERLAKLEEKLDELLKD